MDVQHGHALDDFIERLAVSVLQILIQEGQRRGADGLGGDEGRYRAESAFVFWTG